MLCHLLGTIHGPVADEIQCLYVFVPVASIISVFSVRSQIANIDRGGKLLNCLPRSLHVTSGSRCKNMNQDGTGPLTGPFVPCRGMISSSIVYDA